PYADTKEYLGGYYVIDVPDLDAALAWAEKCPAAQWGYIEIRPSGLG
ncbi:MAG: YciI family protein, partial [Aeromicrobium sp.]